jgi:hypothetical protein
VRIAHITVSLTVTALLAFASGAAAQGANMAEVHIGHVVNAFKDTPQQQGLLPTALEEAKIAIQHAALAAKSPDSVDQMKRHAGHVIHAVDPTVEMKGPGLGYGVKKAAAGIAQHIELAAKAEGAAPAVKTNAIYVSAYANNVVKWSNEVVELAQQIIAASTPAEAARLTSDLTTLTEQLNTGLAAVGKFDAQGGLQQVQQRIEQMKKPSERQ